MSQSNSTLQSGVAATGAIHIVQPAIAVQHPPEVAAYVERLVEKAAQCRLPELFATSHRDDLYGLPPRHGVRVVAVRTPDLTDAQITTLMQYRLAQYLAVNFVDPRMAYDAGMTQEPLSSVGPSDIHLLAGDAITGEILCYIVIMGAPEGPPTATLCDENRPFYPVELAHGRGIFDRLRVLPDLPIARVREMGRFVKNQRAAAPPELLVRAPVELLLACFRLLAGRLHSEIDAVIGDLEEGVAKRNMDFFHAPMVVIHGTVVHVDRTSYKYPMYRYRNHFPFSLLVSDLLSVRARADEIEQALARPGRSGLEALFALKDRVGDVRSSLEPAEGFIPLLDTELDERRDTMSVRRRVLDAGEALRRLAVFRDLSTGEAAILGTLMERVEVATGESMVREGEMGDDIFVIQSGTAEVRRTGPRGRAVVVAVLGPGDYFGETPLVTGGTHIASVVATTPTVLLRLRGESYRHYLADNVEVQLQLTRTTALRAADTLRKLGD